MKVHPASIITLYQFLFNRQEDPTQGWGLFGRFGWANDKTNPIANFYSIGLGGKGMFVSRGKDTWGVGYYYSTLSDEFNRFVSNRFGDSQGAEVFYNIEIKPWLHLTPDFQIINPSNEQVDTAYVAGFRVRMDF